MRTQCLTGVAVIIVDLDSVIRGTSLLSLGSNFTFGTTSLAWSRPLVLCMMYAMATTLVSKKAAGSRALQRRTRQNKISRYEPPDGHPLAHPTEAGPEQVLVLPRGC